MFLFFKASLKASLEVRNEIFLERGVKPLRENGFVNSPFLSSWFGRTDSGDYIYELCRISSCSHLEFLTVNISRGDDWIKIFLNIFQLHPLIQNIEQLNGIDGMQYHLLPNILTNTRLRVDDKEGIPLLNIFGAEHKIGLYFTKSGFANKSRDLSDLLFNDLTAIDSFVEKWYIDNSPLVVNWNGEILI